MKSSLIWGTASILSTVSRSSKEWTFEQISKEPPYAPSLIAPGIFASRWNPLSASIPHIASCQCKRASPKKPHLNFNHSQNFYLKKRFSILIYCNKSPNDRSPGRNDGGKYYWSFHTCSLTNEYICFLPTLFRRG